MIILFTTPPLHHRQSQSRSPFHPLPQTIPSPMPVYKSLLLPAHTLPLPPPHLMTQDTKVMEPRVILFLSPSLSDPYIRPSTPYSYKPPFYLITIFTPFFVLILFSVATQRFTHVTPPSGVQTLALVTFLRLSI